MRTGIHTYLYGSLGTGKTTAVKQAIAKFTDTRNKALYISCSTRTTVHAILRSLIEAVNSCLSSHKAAIHVSIRSNSEIVEQLKAALQKLEWTKFKVVALDHFHAVQETEIVDHLLDLGFIIILVSDDTKAITKLSPAAYSMFTNTICFEDYTQDQVVKILHSKARHLLGEGQFTDTLVKKIAEQCHTNILQGETLLLASALNAVSRKKHVVDETDLPRFEIKGDGLSPDEKTILDILKEQGALQGGTLYKTYCERTKFPKAERTFRNYMKNLCERNLVRAIGTNKGRV